LAERFGNPSILKLIKFDGTFFQEFATSLTYVSSYITELEIDNLNNIWIGTYGQGTFKFDGENWTNYTLTDGLISNNIQNIKCDNQGNIWVAYDTYGIAKYDGVE
jgi:ligand-binding sensor domain-containing protein